MHYKRLAKYGTTDLPKRDQQYKRKCLVCDDLVGDGARGYCSKHYQSWKRYGDPLRSEANSAERATRSKRTYLRVAADKLGRELQPGEFVHHINMDGRDHRPANLHVFPDGASHMRAHHSLNRLVKRLLEAGVIRFEDGEYR
jgi:hypothetical protein